MAVKNYGIHDKWTNINKVNNVEIQSVDGIIENIKVNGEPSGGGDFTTAQVTITYSNGQTTETYYLPILMSNDGMKFIISQPNVITPSETQTKTAVLGKDGCAFIGTGAIRSISGDAQQVEENQALITGDCTITIS